MWVVGALLLDLLHSVGLCPDLFAFFGRCDVSVVCHAIRSVQRIVVPVIRSCLTSETVQYTKCQESVCKLHYWLSQTKDWMVGHCLPSPGSIQCAETRVWTERAIVISRSSVERLSSRTTSLHPQCHGPWAEVLVALTKLLSLFPGKPGSCGAILLGLRGACS